MFGYDVQALRKLLSAILQQNNTADAWTWLSKQGDINNVAAFNAAFVMMPRKTGKVVVSITSEQKAQLNTIRPGFNIAGWTAERLGRVFLFIQADAKYQEHYIKTIENLFLAGEMKELVALYSALPVLAYPESWIKRCAEGIRSNIGIVLEAIMYHNPYPSEHLSEDAWNQLVMKAIFTEKDLGQITGLQERNNPELVRILLDHARERGAAGRTVVPELWQLSEPIVGAAAIADLKQQYSLN
ncbi:EboA domain-containing protein [Mucilaginibacter myungsuensis]|uniref:EboA domain-containing protein n=1 Tax=Mucilaginibacter myungsuensis TaxID=649104 RepID=A0A929PV93_9SPHI|nr:EboA domain-containing protein [Mucilaginibacter myungsuensis]MBE9660771.1 EboA domain-containing protein [Mucilaginibacter myungsuensis]MDN3600816.1 EboA domain-containing protein [Mucilaginibacter myungsuensis]